MPPVTVIILHSEPPPGAGSLERAVSAARRDAAARLEAAFRQQGADAVRVVGGSPDGLAFGRRLALLLPAEGGLVVLGSGSAPLATPGDLRRFVAVASSDSSDALANNRYSADIVAVARADRLPPLPDLPADNALPRWLEEVAGRRVTDLQRTWRLQVDLDGPLDVVLVRESARGEINGGSADGDGGRTAADDVAGLGSLTTDVLDRLMAIRSVLADRRAEAVVSGRTSSASLRWLERHAEARIRAFVEERGLRASSALAHGATDSGPDDRAIRRAGPRPGSTPPSHRPRPPRSMLGMLLDRDGPEALGALLEALGDGAVVDTRVLLAHRLGPDERSWPPPEDRFASDLLLADRVSDPWLRALTSSARSASIPILLGGHSLVGPGIRLVLPVDRARGGPSTAEGGRAPETSPWR